MTLFIFTLCILLLNYIYMFTKWFSLHHIYLLIIIWLVTSGTFLIFRTPRLNTIALLNTIVLFFVRIAIHTKQLLIALQELWYRVIKIKWQLKMLEKQMCCCIDRKHQNHHSVITLKPLGWCHLSISHQHPGNRWSLAMPTYSYTKYLP